MTLGNVFTRETCGVCSVSREIRVNSDWYVGVEHKNEGTVDLCLSWSAAVCFFSSHGFFFHCALFSADRLMLCEQGTATVPIPCNCCENGEVL